jgi:hypothetical protein
MLIERRPTKRPLVYRSRASRRILYNQSERRLRSEPCGTDAVGHALANDGWSSMDEKKNKVLITVVTTCWAFMLWWWFISGGGFLGLLVSLVVAAVVGGATWFVMGLLA